MDALTISDNITTLYVYKIKNFIEKQKLETNSKNFIRLEFVGEFDATITARAKQTNLNLDNKILKLGLNDSLTVAIDDNFIFDENEFYFILGSKYQAHTGLYDAYYFETKIDELIFNDLGDDKIQEFTITKLKSFKELNDIEFIVVNDEDDVNNELEVVNADDKIDITSYQLEFYSSALINQIMHFKNDFFEVPNFEIKDNKKPILIFANPTAVYDNTYSLFLWNISKFYVDNWSVISFFLRRLTLEYHKNYEHYLKQIVNNGSHREILKECAYNTFVEFQGTETQRKEWADKNGNAKSSDINDYLIRNFLAIRPEAEKIKFLSLLLMFSEQIASSYCWKGGLNDEHKAALPMTAYFKDIANEYYVDNPRIVLESLLYSTNEQDNNDIKFGVYNQFLNKNIFFLNGKTVQFALTPDQFEEPELSQRPIDFNNKTLNLNYPFYLFLTEQDTSSILGLSSTIRGHSKEVIKDDILVWSGIKDDNKAQTINWEQEVQKYLASEYPHSEFEFSILGRQDIYTRIVQVPIIIDNNNYYDIHFQKQKLHFNKGKFYLQEVDASQGLGYPPARHEYLKIRVVKKDYDNLFTFENQNLFMINNPNDLNKKINNHINKIEFFTNPDKVIIKGAFLQDYKIILKGGAFENGKEFNIKSDNKLTNKLIFENKNQGTAGPLKTEELLMKLFENLSQKLGISCQEINEKLGIKENASKPEILNALGVYAIFDEKENLSSYIADKISNKTKELEASNLEKEKALNEINELKNQLSNFELTKSHLKELIKNEFNKIDFTTKTDFEQLDINKIDYSNVKKSILQQASELNWEVKEQPQSQEQPQENNFKAKGILTRY